MSTEHGPTLLEADVVIIGCGPVGGIMANLLGARGIRTLILEREVEVYPLPRAVGMDDEVMRILQATGLSDAYEKNVLTLNGMDLIRPGGRRMRRFDLREEDQSLGYPLLTLFHQPTLEAEIRQGFHRYPESVELRLGVEVQDIETGTEEAEVDFVDRESGETFRAKASFVLGCDGSRSFVRKWMGAELEDLGLHQPWAVVDVLMIRPLDHNNFAQNRCDPKRPGTFVPSPPPRNRWEFMLMPGDDPEDMIKPEKLQEMISPWARPEDYEVERAVVYTFHALIAKSWRKGRVMILGDAAHQMPPFLGQGMAAGVRDAFNLAWKLEAVLHGRANMDLLDTYARERAPHVRAVINLAVRLGNIIQSPNPLMGWFLVAAMWLSERLGLEMNNRSAKTIPIGDGCFSKAHPPKPRGRCAFPQPWVRCAHTGESDRLDRYLGEGFVYLTRNSPAASSTSPENHGAIRCLHVISPTDLAGFKGGPSVVDENGSIAQWFDTHKAGGVLLRPDRMPYAIYPVSPPPLEAVERDLAEGLGANGLATPNSNPHAHSERER